MTDKEQFMRQLSSDDESCFLPIGGRTKPALSAGSGEAAIVRLDVTEWAGVVSYDPSEFLITARAGTRVSELVSALGDNGQYLPFDPMFVREGATIGGTVASGLSGPNRMLYGGLRDFLMEVELIDGLGQLVRGGGKVVKNAAGFDLPKLVVGSYGRLGVVTEVTLKVFPTPAEFATLTVPCPDLAASLATAQKLLGQPLPICALELDPGGRLVVRFAGPRGSIAQVLTRTAQTVGLPCEEIGEPEEEQQFWEQRCIAKQFQDRDAGTGGLLIRVATVPGKLPELTDQVASLSSIKPLSYSCGGVVAWLAAEDDSELTQLDHQLKALRLAGIVVAGPASELVVLGDQDWKKMARRIQRSLDPDGKFPCF